MSTPEENYQHGNTGRTPEENLLHAIFGNEHEEEVMSDDYNEMATDTSSDALDTGNEPQSQYKLVAVAPGQITGGELDGQEAYRAVAIAWDLKTGEAKALQEGEAPPEFADFILEVNHDMDNLFYATVLEVAMKKREGVSHEQRYMDTLMSALRLPQEVVCNMLATFLVSTADDNFEAILSNVDE